MTPGACTVGDSEIGEASAEELGDSNRVDTEDRASGERECRERNGKDVGREIEV